MRGPVAKLIRPLVCAFREENPRETDLTGDAPDALLSVVRSLNLY